jgi:lysyl-tRNA synthetase class 2
MYIYFIRRSPLSKSTDNPQIADRFELFINNMEFVNAYAEQNDPEIQREQFNIQLENKKVGDFEAQGMDDGFIKALELGMPPTCGWGIGIDRLVMLLCGVDRIKDVVAFPLMRPLDNN